MNLTVGHNNCYINVIYFLFPSDSEIVVAGGKSVWDSWDWITVEKYNVHTGDPLTLIRVSCQSILKEGLVGLLLIPTDVGLLIPTDVGLLNSFHTNSSMPLLWYCSQGPQLFAKKIARL